MATPTVPAKKGFRLVLGYWQERFLRVYLLVFFVPTDAVVDDVNWGMERDDPSMKVTNRNH